MLDFIRDVTRDINILAIVRIGSQLFSDTPVDIDILCITDNADNTKRFKTSFNDIEYDILIISEAELVDSINLNHKHVHHALYNYSHADPEIIYSVDDFRYPLFDMLDANIKLNYLRLISKYYFCSLYNSNNKYELSKLFTHYYIIISIYENNKVEYTDEMAVDLAKLRNKTEGYKILVDDISTKMIEIYNSSFDKIIEYPDQRNRGIFYQDEQTILEKNNDLLFLRDQLFTELQYDFKNHQLTLILDTVEYDIIETTLYGYNITDIYIYISTNFDNNLHNIGSETKIVGWYMNELP